MKPFQFIASDEKEQIQQFIEATGQTPRKTCPQCQRNLPRSEFGLRSPNKYGKRYSKSWCRQCENVKATSRYYANIDRHRFHNKTYVLEQKYGITYEQYYALLEKQNYACAICHRDEHQFKKMLAVDHDHETGEVRGLLCPSCNNGLGQAQDSIFILSQAMVYLTSKPPKINGETRYAKNRIKA